MNSTRACTSAAPGISWPVRLAEENDVPALETLIARSVRELQAPYYSSAQSEAALGPVFGVDRQLIRDGTYYVVNNQNEIVGCGGWSRRRSLYGSDGDHEDQVAQLDSRIDAARIRAFFVHSNWARRGIGSGLLRACEQAAIQAGFNRAELVATLAGEPLYRRFGYAVAERTTIGLSGGLSLPVVRMTKRLIEASISPAT